MSLWWIVGGVGVVLVVSAVPIFLWVISRPSKDPRDAYWAEYEKAKQAKQNKEQR